MSYVIFNIKTEKLYRKNVWGSQYFEKERGAKMVCTRLNNADGSKDWMVITAEEFSALPIKMKKVKSLMTGIEVEIPEDTPRCADPSSELFWSM